MAYVEQSRYADGEWQWFCCRCGEWHSETLHLYCPDAPHGGTVQVLKPAEVDPLETVYCPDAPHGGTVQVLQPVPASETDTALETARHTIKVLSERVTALETEKTEMQHKLDDIQSVYRLWVCEGEKRRDD